VTPEPIFRVASKSFKTCKNLRDLTCPSFAFLSRFAFLPRLNLGDLRVLLCGSLFRPVSEILRRRSQRSRRRFLLSDLSLFCSPVYNAETVAHVYKALWTVEDIIRTAKSILKREAHLPQVQRDHSRTCVLQLPCFATQNRTGTAHEVCRLTVRMGPGSSRS